MNKNWYCLQVTPNRIASFEEKIASIKDADDEISGKFGAIFSPAENVVEVKRGKRRESQRKFFPNYVFIEMEMDQYTYNLIKHLPMVKGFIGSSPLQSSDWRPPEPIREEEIDRIRNRVEEGKSKPKPKVLFEIGESVRIKDGPFTNFTGNVVNVNYETSRIAVTVNVFSRPTEIQTDFENVEKT